MTQLINIIQTIIGLSLSTLIFLQLRESQNQTNLNTPVKTKRGWEKITMIATIVLLAIFTISSTIRVII
jgi:preprotein translocase subunit SecG